MIDQPVVKGEITSLRLLLEKRNDLVIYFIVLIAIRGKFIAEM
jgi:hypothetical protein